LVSFNEEVVEKSEPLREGLDILLLFFSSTLGFFNSSNSFFQTSESFGLEDDGTVSVGLEVNTDIEVFSSNVKVLHTSRFNDEVDLKDVLVVLLSTSVGIGSKGSTDAPLAEVFLDGDGITNLLLEFNNLVEGLLAEESIEGSELVSFEQVSSVVSSFNTTSWLRTYI